jgi:hypothetical protein
VFFLILIQHITPCPSNASRYLAICFPLKGQMTRSCAKRWIALIWLLSCTISLPWAYYFQLQSHEAYQETDEPEVIGSNQTIELLNSKDAIASVAPLYVYSIAPLPTPLVTDHSNKTDDQTDSVVKQSSQDELFVSNYRVCIEIWPNKASERTYFVLANLFLCYVLPLLLISACYIAIWIKVWRRTVPGETGSKSVRCLAATHTPTTPSNRSRSIAFGSRLNSNGASRLRSFRWWTQNIRIQLQSNSSQTSIGKRSNHNRTSNDSNHISIRLNGPIDSSRDADRPNRFGRLICGEPEVSLTSLDISDQSIRTVDQVPPRPPASPVGVDTTAQPLSLCDLVQPAMLKRYLSSEQLQSPYAQKLLDQSTTFTLAESVLESTRHELIVAPENSNIDSLMVESNGKPISTLDDSRQVAKQRNTSIRTSDTCCPERRRFTRSGSINENDPRIKASLPVTRGQLLCASTSAQLGLKMELILQRSKLKVAKMMIIVVMIFFLSWLPLYFVFTKLKLGLQFTRFASAEDRLTIMLAPFAQWLGASNSCINPLLYAFFNKKYRKEFAGLLDKMRSNRCVRWLCSDRPCTSGSDGRGGKSGESSSTLPPPTSHHTTRHQGNAQTTARATTRTASAARLTYAAQVQRFESMSDLTPPKSVSAVTSVNFV